MILTCLPMALVGRIFKANAAPVGYGNDERRRISHQCTFDGQPCRILGDAPDF
jgi:hypothetical protein